MNEPIFWTMVAVASAWCAIALYREATGAVRAPEPYQLAVQEREAYLMDKQFDARQAMRNHGVRCITVKSWEPAVNHIAPARKTPGVVVAIGKRAAK